MKAEQERGQAIIKEPSDTNNKSSISILEMDSSSGTHKMEPVTTMHRKRKNSEGSSSMTSAQSKSAREGDEGKIQKKRNGNVKKKFLQFLKMSRPMEEDSPGKTEEEEFNTGPLSVLMMSVKKNTQVLINCRNNRQLLASGCKLENRFGARNQKLKMRRMVPSLVDLCVQKVIDNVRCLGDVGEIDSYLLERILSHCTLEQLRHVENSTQFGEESIKLAVERMKQQKKKYSWKQCYEAKTEQEEKRQEKSFERIKKLYQEENAREMWTEVPKMGKGKKKALPVNQDRFIN